MSNTTPPPPPPMPASQPAGPPPSGPPPSNKGLVARVFDLSFSEFITPSIIKLIFVLGIIAASLAALGIFISFASQGGGYIVAGLVVAPLIFAVWVLLARVVAEMYLLMFRIEENTRPR